MAKFKVGDKVRSVKYPKYLMTIVRVGQDIHGTTYFTRYEDYSTPSQTFYERDLLSANSSSNPVVANALAWKNSVACNLGDNPNYNPAEGMKLLETRAFMFKPSMAKKMVEDAMKKGVKVPDKVMAMYKSGVWNSVACNAATITKDSRARNGWVIGTVNGQFFEAKVFDEPSEYGINNGRVSKLHIKGKNGEGTAVAYDRGWDVRPSTPQDKFAFKEVMQTLEKLKPVFNSAPVATNEEITKEWIAKEAQRLKSKLLEIAVLFDKLQEASSSCTEKGWNPKYKGYWSAAYDIRDIARTIR